MDNLEKAEDIIHVHNSGNLPPILVSKCSILPALRLSGTCSSDLCCKESQKQFNTGLVFKDIRAQILSSDCLKNLGH